MFGKHSCLLCEVKNPLAIHEAIAIAYTNWPSKKEQKSTNRQIVGYQNKMLRNPNSQFVFYS